MIPPAYGLSVRVLNIFHYPLSAFIELPRIVVRMVPNSSPTLCAPIPSLFLVHAVPASHSQDSLVLSQTPSLYRSVPHWITLSFFSSKQTHIDRHARSLALLLSLVPAGSSSFPRSSLSSFHSVSLSHHGAHVTVAQLAGYYGYTHFLLYDRSPLLFILSRTLTLSPLRAISLLAFASRFRSLARTAHAPSRSSLSL